jgi:MFS family permease
MVTSGVAGLLAAALSVVTALGHIDVYWVYGMALLLGCVYALDRPAGQAFLYELVGPEQLTRAIGLHSITQSSARMVGPALAGLAYSTLGSAACFAINGASFLCVIAALLWMRREELWARIAEIDRAPPLAQIRDGVRYAAARPELRSALLLSLLIGCFALNFMTTITSMVRLDLQGDASAVGAAHALNAGGAVLGGVLIASLARAPSSALLAATCFGMALTICVNALSPTLEVFLLWAPVFGFSVGAYHGAVLAAVQRATAPAMLGRVSGLLALATTGVMPISSLLAGTLTDLWSTRVAMALGSVACLVGGVALLRLAPQPTPSSESAL